jgi:hypothetical protein
MLCGCTETELTFRTPTEVAMARALTKGQAATGGAEAMNAYLTGKQKAEQTRAISNTVGEAIANITAILAPWNLIGVVSGQWARAYEKKLDAEQLTWRIIDTEDRLKDFEVNLSYDQNGMPIFGAKGRFAPAPKPAPAP